MTTLAIGSFITRPSLPSPWAYPSRPSGTWDWGTSEEPVSVASMCGDIAGILVGVACGRWSPLLSVGLWDDYHTSLGRCQWPPGGIFREESVSR